MQIPSRLRALALAVALVPTTVLAVPGISNAGVFVSITAGFAPPALPVYTQPVCPGVGYLWTPGYWNYASTGYYWVPGVWAQPPSVGLLWTPPYWGYAGGIYRFNAGYWGPTVGFYGGVNYGFGFGGVGFTGGYWNGGNYFYNRAVSNVNVTNIHNTYINNNTYNNNTYNHTSYNGGPGGIQSQPTAEQSRYANEQHYGPTANQEQHVAQAQANRGQYASANGGHPGTTAMSTNRSGFGYGNEVNTRQGNQQSRIAHGVNNGSITPGGERNLENRENSIYDQARTDRAANGGSLTPAERQQINQRQNNVSRSIYNDRHNGINDSTAAARRGLTPGQVRSQAQQQRQATRPRGPQAAHPGAGAEERR